MLTGSTVTYEDPNSYLGSVVETSGNTVLTFAQTISATGSNKKHPSQGWVAIMPLMDAAGTPVTFDKPFMLKTMIELVSISGDYSRSNGDNKNCPQVSLGIGDAASSISATTCKHAFFGFHIRSTGTNDITDQGRLIFASLNTGGNGHITNNVSGSNQRYYDTVTTDWCLGPDLTEQQNFSANVGTYSDSSGRDFTNLGAGVDPYKLNSVTTLKSWNVNQVGFSATQVYLYATLTDTDTSANNGSNTPATITYRLWYQCAGDMTGWGGTGVA